MLDPVISSIYEDTITLRPKAQWQCEKDPAARTNRLGYLFFVADKESFDRGIALRTYFTLDRKVTEAISQMDQESYEAPFITVNSFGIRKKQKQYLRWINAVSIEIDNPEATMADVIHLCQMFDLAYPNLAVKSPNGIHLHWLIERERANRKVLEVYDLITSALKKAFSWIGADAVGPERYWRMPTEYNVIYQHEDRYTLDELKIWAMDTLGVEEEPRPIGRRKENVTGTTVITSGIMQNPAIKRLFQGVPAGVRNRTAFTLALLLFRTQHMSEDEVYTYLSKEWNGKNDVPMKQRELRKSVRSACSGRYRNASAKHINEILEEIGSDLRFRYQVFTRYQGQRQYTKRSTLVERILQYVSDQGGAICMSQRVLAKELNAAFKSIQNAILEIKEANLAEVSTKIGRAGGTVIRLFSNYKEESEGNEIQKPAEIEVIQEQSNVVPMPSPDPEERIKNVVAAFGARRATIRELSEAADMDYHAFFKTFMRLISLQQIHMLDPARDRTARFVLAEKPDG